MTEVHDFFFPSALQKTTVAIFPNEKYFYLVVITCSGARTTENYEMNFLKYLTTPMKLLTYVTLVEVGHLLMASILVGSTFTSPPPITCPRYSKDSFLKLTLIEISN